MIKTSANLFEQQRIVKTRDPVTSYKAAEKVAKSNLQSSMHAKIVSVLSSRQDYSEDTYGFTAKEIAEVISIEEGIHWATIYHAVARRLNESERKEFDNDIVLATDESGNQVLRRSKVGDNGAEVQCYKLKD